MPSINLLHRFFASIIIIFIVQHILNHVLALVSIDLHLSFMEGARAVYRNPVVESLLLISLLAQIVLGLRLVYRSSGKHRGFYQWAQVLSGLYLSFFILLHVAAILNGRYSAGLDTNFYFAASGLYAGKLVYFFVPYYFLAIVAVFTHIACALHCYVGSSSSLALANKLASVIIVAGIIVAALVLAALSGVFYDVTIPETYQAMFEATN